MLTAAEQAELDQLNGLAGHAPATSEASGLTPDEQAELAQLNHAAGVSPQTAAAPQIENDMHPEMKGLKGLKARTVYKALGADPGASFNYLEKQFPDLEFSKDQQGEVLVKSRGDSKAYRLDPTGFDMRDVTDLAYDIPAGVAQGAATAVSGLAGAPAGGIGAVPAAMAGSAASGAALEALRNQLGQMAGIDQSQSGADIGMAGGIGAIAPLMFGTGATAAQAGKMALKEGAKQTAEEILASQRGLLGRGYDAAAGSIGPKLANLAGGENTKVIKQAANMLPELRAADTNPEILAEPLTQAAKQVPKILKEKTREVGGRLDELRSMIDNQPGIVPVNAEGIAMAKGSIDAKPFVAPFQDLAQKLSQVSTGSAGEMADLKKLQGVIESEFKGMPEFLTAAQVDAKMRRFKELASQYGMNYGNSGTTQSTLQGASAVDAAVAKAFEDSRRAMSESIIQRLSSMDENLGKEYLQTNEAYSSLLGLAKDHKSNFKNAKSVQNFLTKATNDDISARDLEKIQEITGVNLEDLAVKSQAVKTFSKPLTEIRSLGRSNTARQVALGTAGGVAGYYAGQQSGGDYSPFLLAALGGVAGSKAASPAMIRKYMEMNSVMRNAPAEVPGMQALPYTLMNAYKNDQK